MTNNLFLINYKHVGKSFTFFSPDFHEVTERSGMLMCQRSLIVLLYSYIERVQNWRMELLEEESCLLFFTFRNVLILQAIVSTEIRRRK
jgi:hypothetical protein